MSSYVNEIEGGIVKKNTTEDEMFIEGTIPANRNSHNEHGIVNFSNINILI